jgi:hypothetical protein
VDFEDQAQIEGDFIIMTPEKKKRQAAMPERAHGRNAKNSSKKAKLKISWLQAAT